MSLNFNDCAVKSPAVVVAAPVYLGQRGGWGPVASEQLLCHQHNQHGAPKISKMANLPNFVSQDPEELRQIYLSSKSQILRATRCTRVRSLHTRSYEDINFRNGVSKPANFGFSSNFGYLAAVERANVAKRARSVNQWTIDSGASSHFSP